MAVTFKLNLTEFNRTLKTYTEYSRRDLPVICNTKAFYIARRATVETPKVRKGKAKRELMRPGTRTGGTAPLAALILNARRRSRVGEGLYGEAMRDAILALIAVREMSSAFLKSGWLPAIKALEPFAEKIGGRVPRQDRTARQIGRPKGGATPARLSAWTQKSVIQNTASAKRDYKEALATFGGPALQRAFDAESRSMKEYIERKQRTAAKSSGIRIA